MTHDVQLPAMMCNYTFYTYKINALALTLKSRSREPEGKKEKGDICMHARTHTRTRSCLGKAWI